MCKILGDILGIILIMVSKATLWVLIASLTRVGFIFAHKEQK